ncbi:Hint domain-containing protein, partial [Planktotalea sp.]|uniref:Hint domain-containing protein n=1 Tax=Planktotalea sp. TaxID=2029877 RepID=UPI003297647A
MAPTDVIINGDFTNSTNNSAAGWSGTDIETRGSSVYIAGTGTAQGRVAELNGGTGAVTVIEQTFTLASDHDGILSFDYALRTSGTSGTDGFKVEILDSGGGVIYTNDFLPTLNSYQTFTVPVDFPSAGDYTIRFTEIGDNADGSGAVLDNVELLVCYDGRARILTPDGYTNAADLQVGQLVETLNGSKPIRWIGRRSVSADEMASDARYSPVRICKGALGGGLPEHDLLVSRQHRIMISSPIAKRMFGDEDTLIPAIRLTELPGIFIDTSVEEIDYIHILLDDHEVLLAEGAPAE